MMDKNTEFLKTQQAAIERMREMSRRSTSSSPHTMPPAPSFVKVNGGSSSQPHSNNMHENAYKSEDAPEPTENRSHGNEKRRAQQSEPSIPFLSGFDIPMLDRLRSEPDMALILGLILLLWSEKADKRLMLALLYIIF